MAIAQPATAVRNPYSKLPNWLYPTFVVGVLSLFGIFAVWVVVFQPAGRFGPYLSPFDSPRINLGPIPPGILGRLGAARFSAHLLLLPQGLLPILAVEFWGA